MNKKDTVKTNILEAHDGFTFSVKSMAKICKVEEKDVGNVVTQLVRAAVLSKTKCQPVTKGQRAYNVYSVDSNMAALWFAKNPINGGPVDKPAAKDARQAMGEKAIGVSPTPVKTRAKPRSHFVMAIDDEIAELQCKIKRLNAVRKEFA